MVAPLTTIAAIPSVATLPAILGKGPARLVWTPALAPFTSIPPFAPVPSLAALLSVVTGFRPEPERS